MRHPPQANDGHRPAADPCQSNSIPAATGNGCKCYLVALEIACMNIQTICICGAGTMGRGIAQVCAAAGFKTLVFDPSLPVLAAARTELEQNVARQVEKGRLPADAAARLLGRLHFTAVPQECVADLVIEAIVEVPEIKQSLFAQLCGLNSGDTLIATNTSSLSVTVLSAAIPNPGRFAGLHFFNPAPLMPLVEIVKGDATTDATVITLEELVRQLGKTPVHCSDAPGFIVNRVARPYYIEALRLAESGIPLEQIDRLMEARGFKMGPFRLMDLIGNDVNYAVSCSVYSQLGAPERLKPSPLQAQKVADGAFGKKSGRGFYGY